MFTLKNISVQVGEHSLLQNINLVAKSTEITGLIGKSGSGKSTLFRLALGLLDPTDGYTWSGSLFWKEEKLPNRKNPKLQPVFQDPLGSFSHIGTMRELLLEPVRIKKGIFLSDETKQKEWVRIESLCHRFELSVELLNKTKQELSGGQLQRFSILRALLMDPEYLLLDEPVTALDVLVQKKIAEELKQINQTENLGMFIVSHDLGFLSYMCDQIFVLDAGEIVEFGKPKEILSNPKSELLNTLKEARNHSFGGAVSSSESSS
ncbi:ABC transporter ATP-binding protein [Leptospira bandrabouensis]|uniref:ATP-binding cassette domain-containing protein n=1 Tax=Leptospira bandrabouensis TaxID=2484903 RepID=A0A6H3NNT0_9LEPT|nr:ATP-binding cassette domain-containing protein [Leptospira bandrabouensis]MCG6144836.1 ATP-binding cassette domain-containing protein [Leptospira bandrabouensis]MCG6160527.1 ATP-binding cassette domain-containing protein [Leptospira bandrabouensis]MCG6164459.1 ATP-binding cassette domain-containing protein [Leptospira bandrabouensis]TGN03658.1 ATP-binding cassette domain-containing protein [Leptospira bandrabouensis]TGN12317.1 ATP-binding cassette domain-containing protein [Leptospira bandr